MVWHGRAVRRGLLGDLGFSRGRKEKEDVDREGASAKSWFRSVWDSV